MHWLWRGLLDVLFPPRCLVCREFGPDVICGQCAARIHPIRPPVCKTCGLPLDPLAKADGVCGECRMHNWPFVMGRAYGYYDGALREAIWGLKYQCKRALAPTLGALMKSCFEDARSDNAPLPAHEIDVICPVPLHRVRLRERGFNQSEALARCLGRLLGVPVEGLLIRARLTEPQVGLPHSKRRENVRRAFAVAEGVQGASLKGRRVLVLDDVWTTGETLRECARVLNRAGAEVYVIALARAVNRPIEEA